MGSGASTGAAAAVGPSVDDVGKWSEEEVGQQVASLGKAFEPYRQLAVDNGVDGDMLLDVDDEELEGYGINNKGHRKKILKKVEGIRAAAAGQQPRPRLRDSRSRRRNPSTTRG